MICSNACIWGFNEVREPRLVEEAARQSALASRQDEEAASLAFIEDIADLGGEA